MSDAPIGRDGGAPRAARQLGLFTVLCIGINNIVGSGIYRKPSELAAALGGASWIAFAAGGLLLVTVALCFAAMAARHDQAGGPYLYAKAAFGPWAGFVVAWTAWISMWTALAGTATAIPGYLAVFVPAAGGRLAAAALGLAIVAALGWINCRGVKSAAGTATFLTVAKLLPLLVFVGAGLAAVDWSRIEAWPTAHGIAAANALAHPGTPPPGLLSAFGGALIAAFYPLQGFEVVPVPAGELKNAKRDVPLSLTLALLGSAAFYCLIQIVAVGTLPSLAAVKVEGASVKPLAEAAATFLGGAGEKLMAAGACISMLGFSAVTMFCAPRFLVALGSDGLLPAAFARHDARRAVPTVAIVVTTASALFGALFPFVDALGGQKSFESLTNLSNLAVLVQYGATCLAVVKLRARIAGGRFLLPLLGLATCGWFLALIAADPSWLEQVVVFAAWVALGVFLCALSRRASPRAPAGSR